MITLSLQERKDRILFLDGTDKHFDENLYPKPHDYLFKFVMIKEVLESPLKMLVMSIMNYHPNGVFQYMTDNHLKSIYTSGGGKLSFSGMVPFAGFSGTSKSFGAVSVNDQEQFMQTMWPKREIYCKNIDLPPSAKQAVHL